MFQTFSQLMLYLLLWIDIKNSAINISEQEFIQTKLYYTNINNHLYLFSFISITKINYFYFYIKITRTKNRNKIR